MSNLQDILANDETQKTIATAPAVVVAGALVTPQLSKLQAVQNLSNSVPVRQITNLGSSLKASVDSLQSVQSGLKVARTVSKGVKAAGGIGAAVDVVFGAMEIDAHAKANTSEGMKAYNITGDIIGIAANVGIGIASATTAVSATAASVTGVASAATTAGTTVAAGAATGPGVIVALAIALAQILGGILDSFWNPFKGYFNKDIEQIRKAYNDATKKQMLLMSLNWPLEIKPDLMGTLGDPETMERFKQYVKNYYDDNGLISKEDVLKEEDLYRTMRDMKRYRKKFTSDEDGNLTLKDPVLTALSIQEELDQNMLLLLALAAYTKKMRDSRKTPSILQNYVAANWTSFLFLFLVIFLSVISSI
jgi:hypothetical protein